MEWRKQLMQTQMWRERECNTASLQPPYIGGRIYLARERQCWPEGTQKVSRKKHCDGTLLKKKRLRQELGGAEPRWGPGVSVKEASGLDPKKDDCNRATTLWRCQ